MLESVEAPSHDSGVQTPTRERNQLTTFEPHEASSVEADRFLGRGEQPLEAIVGGKVPREIERDLQQSREQLLHPLWF